MLASLDSHFREKGLLYSKTELWSEQTDTECKGNWVARSWTWEEEKRTWCTNWEEILWSTGVLGGENPTSPNHTMFHVLSQEFEKRACQEHNQMQIEDFKCVINPDRDWWNWIYRMDKGIDQNHTRRPLYLTPLRKPHSLYMIFCESKNQNPTWRPQYTVTIKLVYRNYRKQVHVYSNDKINVSTGHKSEQTLETMLQLIWKIIRKPARFWVARNQMQCSL